MIAGLTETGSVDGLHRLLHLIQNTAVHIQSLNTKNQTVVSYIFIAIMHFVDGKKIFRH